MASITSRKRQIGSTAHMARIVIKRKGKVVQSENKHSTKSKQHTLGRRSGKLN